jgi:membrane protein DedA with SNARE-associated domain
VFDHLGTLLSSPWVYALVGTSILLDVFLPVLPSGALLIAAATAGSANHAFRIVEIASLLLCAATASCLGDLAAYHLARSGGKWFERRVDRSPKLATVQVRLREVVAHGGGTLVVLARFAPAGRSIVSVAAGAAHQRIREFLPWSALAGVTWAAYSVGVGYLGGHWLGASWFATALSFCALLAAGSVAARVFRRGERALPPGAPVSQVTPVAPAAAES